MGYYFEAGRNAYTYQTRITLLYRQFLDAVDIKRDLCCQLTPLPLFLQQPKNEQIFGAFPNLPVTKSHSYIYIVYKYILKISTVYVCTY